MSNITPAAMKAYTDAMNFDRAEKTGAEEFQGQTEQAAQSFSETIQDSLSRVNDMQLEGAQKTVEFAAGEEENVHELMITLQKAGLAMKMTSAVRNKAMEAYKELMRIRV